MALNSQSSNQSLRVTMLIWSYWPGHEGGAEKQCRKIIPYLVRHGIQVTVVTARTSRSHLKREKIDGCQIIRLGLCVATIAKLSQKIERVVARFPVGALGSARTQSKRREALAFWFSLPLTMLSRTDFMLSLRRWLKNSDTRPDVVHVHESSWLAGAAAMLARPYEIPVLAKTAVSPALPILGYDTPLRSMLTMARQECHFIALTTYLAADLQRAGASNSITILPNGVDVDQAPMGRDASKDVLFVANFSQSVEDKAFDILLQAWQLLIEQEPDAKLFLLGAGNHEPWVHLVKAMEMEESTVFLGWVDDPSIYYRRASLFVLPSRSEGMSNALLEAQSYGLACIVSDIPSNRAVVEDNMNGIVVPVGDATALAEALVRLLRNEHLRNRLGRMARESAVTRFSLEHVTSALTNVYRSLADIRSEQP
jgi:glycosyltransferase involved in cell wall biosynthesis